MCTHGMNLELAQERILELDSCLKIAKKINENKIVSCVIILCTQFYKINIKVFFFFPSQQYTSLSDN